MVEALQDDGAKPSSHAADPLPADRVMMTRLIPCSNQAIPVIGMGTWQTFDPPSLEPGVLEPLQEVLRIFYEGGAGWWMRRLCTAGRRR